MFNKIIEWLKWLSPASIKKDTERLLALAGNGIKIASIADRMEE